MGIGLYGTFGLFRNDGGNDHAKETSMANHRLGLVFADVGSLASCGRSNPYIRSSTGLALPGEGP